MTVNWRVPWWAAEYARMYNAAVVPLCEGLNQVKMMKSRIITSIGAAFLLAVGMASMPAHAQKAATPSTVKIGYFNLALVKASYPEAAGSETLRTNAENMLRRDVEEGNKRLQDMQTAKKPQEDIQKSARELQIEINAKQQGAKYQAKAAP